MGQYDEIDFTRIRDLVARCKWTFAKTMPFAPHEYIVRGKCPLTEDDFDYFVNMQREHGIRERWGKYNNPYLYIGDYKYWTMGAPIKETTVINRAKACVVNDVHKLYEGINNMEKNHIDEYIHKQLQLKDDDKGFNIELINGRLKEISDCVANLEKIRNDYCCAMVQEWSERLTSDFPELKKCESISPGNIIYTGVSFPFDDRLEAISARIQIDKGNLYYGVTYMPSTKERRADLQEAFSYLNKDGNFIKGSDWLYYIVNDINLFS